ncbi:hypothetical protein [Erwinia sp. V71]|uniref:hypothetical protein n=1 Tax=Erwinia sp. V71 TaxID=3369424 RepID=UPI003F6349DF
MNIMIKAGIAGVLVAALAGCNDDDAPPKNSIWSYVNTADETLWKLCHGKENSCTLLTDSKHFAAVVNNKPDDGCAAGNLYILEHKRTTFRRVETGGCAPGTSIIQSTFPDNILTAVKVMNNNQMIKVYPIGQWSMRLDVAGDHVPPTDAEKARFISQWAVVKNVYSVIGNYDNSSILLVDCPNTGDVKAIKFITGNNSYRNHEFSLSIDDTRYPLPDDASGDVNSWNKIFTALQSAETVTAQAGDVTQTFNINKAAAEHFFAAHSCVK